MFGLVEILEHAFSGVIGDQLESYGALSTSSIQ
jgi:hypothetical protein